MYPRIPWELIADPLGTTGLIGSKKGRNEKKLWETAANRLTISLGVKMSGIKGAIILSASYLISRSFSGGCNVC
jgi:hypothetical protein